VLSWRKIRDEVGAALTGARRAAKGRIRIVVKRQDMMLYEGKRCWRPRDRRVVETMGAPGSLEDKEN